jgi:hypothetical protein
MSSAIAPPVRTRLLALATREFRRTSDKGLAAPAPRTFKAMRLNLAKFDDAWDRKRGAAVRMTGVLLRENANTLLERVCADPQIAETYKGAAAWLQLEARYLRQVAGLLDTAVGRLDVVLTQCAERTNAVPQM